MNLGLDFAPVPFAAYTTLQIEEAMVDVAEDVTLYWSVVNRNKHWHRQIRCGGNGYQKQSWVYYPLEMRHW